MTKFYTKQLVEVEQRFIKYVNHVMSLHTKILRTPQGMNSFRNQLQSELSDFSSDVSWKTGLLPTVEITYETNNIDIKVSWVYINNLHTHTKAYQS